MGGTCCTLALFEGELNKLNQKTVELPDLEEGEILAQTSCATICGSDLHTIEGKRSEPVPLILGHEMIAKVKKIKSEKPIKDYWGQTIKLGDTITWSVVWSCDECERCLDNLPQKCLNLFKYGHERFENSRSLNGAFSEYCLLRKNTKIYKVPNGIEESVLSPSNCATATAASCIDEVNVKNKTVLVQGGGLLGLMICAMSNFHGAKKTALVDMKQDRTEMALQFGAQDVFCLSDKISKNQYLNESSNNSFDVVFECSGSTEAMSDAMKKLKINGEYILAGAVFPTTKKSIDPETIIRKMLTIKGVHNYKPHHLAKALTFLKDSKDRFPYEKIVGKTFPLQEINSAVSYAQKGLSLRTAIKF